MHHGQKCVTCLGLRKEHTHCDAIYIRLLGFVIILFQGPFTDSEGGADGKGEVGR